MFISKNRPSFDLWWKENLLKHRNASKYYETDCRLAMYLKVVSTTFLPVCFLSLNKSTCKTSSKASSLQKLFPFSRKPNFRILEFQISWCHLMPKYKTRNTFYCINWKVSTVCKWNLAIWWRHGIWISENLKFDYLKNENSFRSEIKNIFPCFTNAVF